MIFKDQEEPPMTCTAHIFCDREYHDWSGLEIFAPRKEKPRTVIEAVEADEADEEDEDAICKFMQIPYTLMPKLTWIRSCRLRGQDRGNNGRSSPISRQRFLSEKY